VCVTRTFSSDDLKVENNLESPYLIQFRIKNKKIKTRAIDLSYTLLAKDVYLPNNFRSSYMD
jgi:hypothetical protein